MKKERLDGTVVVVYEKGDGIRRRFRAALADERYHWPRKGLVHHPEGWYISGAPLKRPLFGVYALAALAEDVLWRARYGKRRKPDFDEANRFFAESRRALQNVLSTYPFDKRLTRKELSALRRVVARLITLATPLVNRVAPFSRNKENQE